MHIRPLSQLTDREIGEIARAAADRGESHEHANPFQLGTTQRTTFERAFQEREACLQSIT